jgi:hypothetical protein
LHFKAQIGFKSHWTKPHYAWLRRTIKGSSGSLRVNLTLLLRQIRDLDQVLAEYGQHIEELAATPPLSFGLRHDNTSLMTRQGA